MRKMFSCKDEFLIHESLRENLLNQNESDKSVKFFHEKITKMLKRFLRKSVSIL